MRVDGVLEGEVITDDTFIIGSAAKVTGEIKAGVVIVMGRMDGKIHAKEKCEVRIGSHVSGDIFTPSIYIEEGAVFEGACQMTGGSSGDEASAEEAKEEAEPAEKSNGATRSGSRTAKKEPEATAGEKDSGEDEPPAPAPKTN